MTSQLTDAQRNEGQHTNSSTWAELHRLTDRHTQVMDSLAHRETHVRLLPRLPATQRNQERPVDPSPWAESPDDKLRHTEVQGQAHTWRVTHIQTQEHTHNSVRPSTNARIPVYDHRSGKEERTKGKRGQRRRKKVHAGLG